ncbi:CLIP domain-containing serine protease 14D-like [Vanessa cardui]|uniref:CLIP domain-containing serine protease 14D-like n=1 Tax=Vanessa cardui TaxID=171605 RepID=UPI001F135639|nr:CLIP domain-containing serine protease 14D-like [Vanessa cardui]
MKLYYTMDKIILTSSYFLVLLVTGYCQNIEVGEPCETKFYNGTCVTLASCPSAVALVRIRDIKTLRVLLCGFKDKQPKVCCPASGNIITFTNKTDETATSRPKKPLTTKLDELTTATTETYSDPFPDRKVCGQVKATDRIIGGTIADIDEFPWLGRISYSIDDENKFIFACSASLITDRYLVTAAHCVQSGRTLVPVSVRLGEWDEQTIKDCNDDYCNDSPPVDIKISKIITYPTYSKENLTQDDIALIELEKPVNFTNFIQPVCLPTTEYTVMQDYVHGSSYWVAGWGLTEFGTASPIKRKVKLEAVPSDTCKGILKNIPETSFSKLICAGGRQGKDSCKGDSGGPLVREVMENYQANWYLFGITSLGANRCGTEGVPGVYTRVIRYMDWIRENVAT